MNIFILSFIQFSRYYPLTLLASHIVLNYRFSGGIDLISAANRA
jgi:hypothetical protein